MFRSPRLLLHFETVWQAERRGGRIPWNRFGSSLYAELLTALRRSRVPFDVLSDATLPEVEAFAAAFRPSAILSNSRLAGPGDEALQAGMSRRTPWIHLPTGHPSAPGHRIRLADGHAMDRLVSHLLGRGFRRIGFVSFATSSPRLEAWKTAMRERGLPFSAGSIELATSPPREPMESHRKTLLFLRRHFVDVPPDLDALVASNDVVARILIDQLRTLGRRVPEDVAVTGIDGLESEEVTPSLTTIQIDLTETARQAVDLAVRLSNEGPQGTARTVSITGRLRIGATTLRTLGPIPEWVVGTGENLPRLLAESDPASILARGLGWKKATFLKNFHKATKEGFPAHLSRLRADRAKELLEKGRPIHEVCERCGFASPRSFYRALRTAFQRTPGELRRKGR